LAVRPAGHRPLGRAPCNRDARDVDRLPRRDRRFDHDATRASSGSSRRLRPRHSRRDGCWPDCERADDDGIVVLMESASKPRLVNQVREAIRTRHYSRRTEDVYVQWIRRYIVFHDNYSGMPT
jgi:hypothetical protein